MKQPEEPERADVQLSGYRGNTSGQVFERFDSVDYIYFICSAELMWAGPTVLGPPTRFNEAIIITIQSDVKSGPMKTGHLCDVTAQ